MDSGNYRRAVRSSRCSRWFSYLEWFYIMYVVLFN